MSKPKSAYFELSRLTETHIIQTSLSKYAPAVLKKIHCPRCDKVFDWMPSGGVYYCECLTVIKRRDDLLDCYFFESPRDWELSMMFRTI